MHVHVWCPSLIQHFCHAIELSVYSQCFSQHYDHKFAVAYIVFSVSNVWWCPTGSKMASTGNGRTKTNSGTYSGPKKVLMPTTPRGPSLRRTITGKTDLHCLQGTVRAPAEPWKSMPHIQSKIQGQTPLCTQHEEGREVHSVLAKVSLDMKMES